MKLKEVKRLRFDEVSPLTTSVFDYNINLAKPYDLNMIFLRFL